MKHRNTLPELEHHEKYYQATNYGGQQVIKTYFVHEYRKGIFVIAYYLGESQYPIVDTQYGVFSFRLDADVTLDYIGQDNHWMATVATDRGEMAIITGLHRNQGGYRHVA